MEVSAVHKNARMAPRKIRPLAKMLRGMPVAEANQQLRFLPGGASDLIRSVLQSAMANATHNHNIKEDTLKVSQVLVDEGIVMRRFNPVSRGMAHPIKKRTSHITVIVDGEEEKGKKKGKAKADIQEISAEDYAVSQVKEDDKGVQEEISVDEASNKKDSEKRPVSSEHNKTEYEALQKKKMQQQGGDKKKTHRRKSIG